MNFEINLPGQKAQYFLRTAGLETLNFHKMWWRVVMDKKGKLPVEISSRYFLSERPVEVRITILSFSPTARLKIETDDHDIGKKIHDYLKRWPENKMDSKDNEEHKKLWAQIDEILRREGVSHQELQRGAELPRSAIEPLMELCEKTEWYRWDNIHTLFTGHAVAAKADRLLVARWLIKLFETDRDPNSQVSLRIWDLTVPQIADDLIRLIQDRRHGENRCVLCLALAKTKHPRAAEVISSVLGEEGMTGCALEALGKLKATEHAESVRKFLSDTDAHIRREAKKALKKMGLPTEIPPSAVHLVKNRRSVPDGLEEWSSNLDMENLEPTLQALSKCVESGFGPREIAEVTAVVEEMEHDQTKAFRFPISGNGQKSEVWLEVFMDDIDSPDLAIHARPELIRKLELAMPERD